MAPPDSIAVEPDSTVRKVAYMRKSDLPDPLVKLLIGRRLADLFDVIRDTNEPWSRADQDELWMLLKALNDMGAFSREQWVTQAMGLRGAPKKRN